MAGSASRTYDKRRVQAICAAELQAAQGYQGDEIEANREQALAYYNGDPRGDEQEGLSKVQSLDVADMVEAVLSFMVPSLTSQSLVQFASVGAEDEEQAAKESRIVQSLVRAGKSNAYVAIQEGAKDALLLRNGILKVWIEHKSHISRETFALPGGKDGPELEAVAAVLEADSADQEKTISSSTAIPKSKGGGWSVTVKTVDHSRRLRMGAVDPCNFYFAADAACMDVEALRFCAERELPTRSELIEEGIPEDQVAALPQYGGATRTDINKRRRSSSEQTAEDFWQQRIEVFRCYPLLGTGEGGRSERWLVTMANARTLLSRERVRCVPYGVGAALFGGHSFQGISLFDKLRETQDTKTGFLRAWLNNSQFVNVPRAALLEQAVNEDDFYDVRVGGGIKVTKQGAIEWVQVPDIGPSCAAGLDYQDKMRAERGGASLEMMKPGLQLSSDTAAGTEREMSVKEQLAALMAANLAQTMLRAAYLVAHKLVRYEMGSQVSARDGGEWLEDSPGKWPERDDVSIVIGLSPGERARRLQALGAVITKQGEVLREGLDDELTTRGQLHRSLIEWTRAAGIDAPERYWTDPDSPEAKQAHEQKRERAKSVGAAQAEVLGRIKILESQVDTYKVQLQEAGKYWSEVIRAEVEEMKILGHSTAQLEAAKVGAAGRSAELLNASNETAAAAGANAAKPMPEAGQLPPGSLQ